MDSKQHDAHMAWCYVWNNAIKNGLRPIEALKLANMAYQNTMEN